MRSGSKESVCVPPKGISELEINPLLLPPHYVPVNQASWAIVKVINASPQLAAKSCLQKAHCIAIPFQTKPLRVQLNGKSKIQYLGRDRPGLEVSMLWKRAHSTLTSVQALATGGKQSWTLILPHSWTRTLDAKLACTHENLWPLTACSAKVQKPEHLLHEEQNNYSEDGTHLLWGGHTGGITSSTSIYSRMDSI